MSNNIHISNYPLYAMCLGLQHLIEEQIVFESDKTRTESYDSIHYLNPIATIRLFFLFYFCSSISQKINRFLWKRRDNLS